MFHNVINMPSGKLLFTFLFLSLGSCMHLLLKIRLRISDIVVVDQVR